MKKLLYAMALVALFNSNAISQSCSNVQGSIDFQTPVAGSIIPVSATSNATISFKVTALSLIDFITRGAQITGATIVSHSGGHVTGAVTFTNSFPTVTATFSFTVNTPNTPGSEVFTVMATFKTNDGSGLVSGCTVSDVVSVNTTPIELLAFTGKQTSTGAVKLNWVTASERDNALFMVERSNNGVNFTAVGEVKGAGNSSSNIDYAYTDATAVNNAVNYYRLTDVDVNGKKSSSRVISVIVGKNAPLTIDAVAVEQGFVSLVSPSTGVAELSISNVQGQVLSNVKTTLNEGANQVQINTENLNPGIYFLNIVNNDRTAQTKFFKN